MSPSHDPSTTGSPSPRRLLVVLHEPTLRLGFAYALLNPANEVDTAASGIEALERLQSARYDLVFLDLRMPGMDGIRVIETLREHGNRVPVVLCTALQHPNATWRALSLGVVDFLLKPAKPADIRRMVDFVLGPDQSKLSEALRAAREGEVTTAIRTLGSPPQPDAVESCWLKCLQRIRHLRQDGDDPELEEEIRSCFPVLAFNRSPAGIDATAGSASCKTPE